MRNAVPEGLSGVVSPKMPVSWRAEAEGESQAAGLGTGQPLLPCLLGPGLPSGCGDRRRCKRMRWTAHGVWVLVGTTHCLMPGWGTRRVSLRRKDGHRQTGRERRRQKMEHGAPLGRQGWATGTWVLGTWALCYFSYLFVTFKLFPNDNVLKVLTYSLPGFSEYQQILSCKPAKDGLVGMGRMEIAFLDALEAFQSPIHVWLFVTPWTAACQAALSFTISQSLPKLMSIESVMPSNHLILCRPLLLLPSDFPNIRVFTNKLAVRIRWPKYWSFSFSPSSDYSGLISFRIHWLDLLAVQGTRKSLLQHHFKYAQITHGNH